MKDNKFLLGIIVGVLVCLVLGGCFYLGTRFANKEDEKKTPDTKENYQSVKITDSLVEDANKYIARDLCGGTSYPFDQKSRTINQISSSDKMQMLASIYSSEILSAISNHAVFTLDTTDLLKYFDDISFLDDYKDSKDDNTVFFGLPYTLNYSAGKFTIEGYATGCTGVTVGDVIVIYDAKKNDEELILIGAYAFSDSPVLDDNELHQYFYKSKNEKNPIDKDPAFDEELFINKLSFDKYDHYEFVYDITGSAPKLKAINFVK